MHAANDTREFRIAAAALGAMSVLLAVGSFLLVGGLIVDPAHLVVLLFLGLILQLCALLTFPWRTGYMLVIGAPLLAIGLIAPGWGAILGNYLLTWDRYLPGRNISLFQFIARKGSPGLSHGVAALAVTMLPLAGGLEIPLKAVIYAAVVTVINLPLTATMIGLNSGASPLRVLRENVSAYMVLAFLGQTFIGGVMYLLLFPDAKRTNATGFIMTVALVGIVVLIRNAMQTSEARERERQQTLLLAAHALDARDQYTAGHSLRVADIAGRIGRQLGLPDSELNRLRTAASLHDIGKIGISDTILNKPDRLTDEEFAIIKSHPDMGADMIQAHSALSDMAPAVRYHHERWDGTGYPEHLAGEGIPLHARIIAVADSYDTITTMRVYRRSKMEAEEAVADIEAHAGTWFDPRVAAALRMAVLGTPAPQVRWATAPVAPSRRTFNLIFAGSVISALGDPISLVTVVTLVSFAYGSALALAAVFMIRAIGNLLSASLLGALLDQVERKWLIVTSDTARAATLIATALLVGSHRWVVFPAMALLSICDAVVTPARLAAVKSSVDPGFLQRALALVNTSALVAGVVAYPAAGILNLVFPSRPWIMFLIDAATFIASAAITLAISRLGGSRAAGLRMNPGGAFALAWSFRSARPLLVVVAGTALLIGFASPVQVMLARLFGDGGSSNGLSFPYAVFQSSVAVGAVIGLILIQRLRERDGLWMQVLGYVVLGSFVSLISLTTSLWLAALLFVLGSIGNPLFSSANQAELLRVAGDEHAGSMMVTRFMTFQTMTAVGSLVAGALVSRPVDAGLGMTAIGVGFVSLGLFCFVLYRRRRAELSGEAGALHPIQ